MEIKRFVGQNAREALRKVREQLGPDAMVLSNTRGPDGVEVIAAPADIVSRLSKGPPGVLKDIGKSNTQGHPVMLPEGSQAFGQGQSRIAHGGSNRESELREELRVVGRAISQQRGGEEVSLQSMRDELRSLRNLLESRLARGEALSWAPRTREGTESLIGRLENAGFSAEFSRQIADSISLAADGEAAVKEAFASVRARMSVSGDLVARGGCFAFIGPTGAGKTTTLCKLAVRQALKHGSDSLVLLSLDHYRLGAGEMLGALARVLDASVRDVSEPEDLADELDRYDKDQLVLIDTAGLGGLDRARDRQLSVLAELTDRVTSLLVLPANCQARSLAKSVRSYQLPRPAAMVMTKLDDTASLGEISELSMTRGIPIAYTTNGPEIPEDIAVADPVSLVADIERLGSASGESNRSAGPGESIQKWAGESYNANGKLAATVA